MPYTPDPLNKTKQIGLHQLSAIENLPTADRMALLSEGLPIILQSARELVRAAAALPDHDRAAEILRRHGEEEATKILILMDYVRCPPGRSDCARKLLATFYKHGDRLIYGRACSWRPIDLNQLRTYVDGERESHYIEGANGEWIVPNADLYRREAALYVDLERHDDGTVAWSQPRGWKPMFNLDPAALQLAEAFDRLGMLSMAGLSVVADVWSATDYTQNQHAQVSDRLIQQTLEGLESVAAISPEATEVDVRVVHGSWQMPMYALDFGLKVTPLERLRAAQQTALDANYS